MALVVASGVHAVAIGALFLRISPPTAPDTDMPAIAVEMASPTAPPAPVHDAPTPRQIEAPPQTPQRRQPPQPKILPFDPPPLKSEDAKPEVVLPPEKEDQPPTEKRDPLPAAPTTTEEAAPDLKPEAKTAALLDNGASSGKATPVDLWDARVLARIELMKRYPGAAALQNQQDEVDVLLVVDRDGNVLSEQIRASKGFPLLDDAALDAVRRAAPFPKPPKDIEGESIRLSVIVRFFKKTRQD